MARAPDGPDVLEQVDRALDALDLRLDLVDKAAHNDLGRYQMMIARRKRRGRYRIDAVFLPLTMIEEIAALQGRFGFSARYQVIELAMHCFIRALRRMDVRDVRRAAKGALDGSDRQAA